jgi:hypothetical protein
MITVTARKQDIFPSLMDEHKEEGGIEHFMYHPEELSK